MRMILRTAMAIVFSLATACAAQAQQRPRQPPEKYSPQPVQPPAPATPQSSAPAAPAQPPAPSQPHAFVHSPWVKFCGRDKADPQAKDVCLTMKEARLDTGQFVAGAAVIEQAGSEQKLLRVTLPLGMQLMPGVRMFIDGEVPRTAAYGLCVQGGCMADFAVNSDFIARLKKGRELQLQGINMPGQLASYLLPLGDFAKAFDGPPSDPSAFQKR
jgi:invasion protein IalB